MSLCLCGKTLVFRKTKEKLQDEFAPFQLSNRALRWIQKLLGLAPGADSKSGARVEQYQDVKTTVRSVEITVERAEMIKVEKATRRFSERNEEIRLDGSRQ